MGDKAAEPRSVDMRAMTAEIVSSYLRGNTISVEQVPLVIRVVFDALRAQSAARAVESPRAPAVPVRRSVHPDYIVCLECGARRTTLKRHLRTAHGLNVEAYRATWGLPEDYPMAARAYSARRAAYAKQIGLGRRPGNLAEPEAVPNATKAAPEAMGRRTRPKR